MGRFKVVSVTLAAVMGGALLGALIGLISTLLIALALLRGVDLGWHPYAGIGYWLLALAWAVVVAIVTGCIGAVTGYAWSDPGEADLENTEESEREDLAMRYQTRSTDDYLPHTPDASMQRRCYKCKSGRRA